LGGAADRANCPAGGVETLLSLNLMAFGVEGDELSATKILWGQITFVSLIVLLTIWAATGLVLNQIRRRLTEDLHVKNRHHRVLLMLDELPRSAGSISSRARSRSWRGMARRAS
jgi:hypothetical protein